MHTEWLEALAKPGGVESCLCGLAIINPATPEYDFWRSLWLYEMFLSPSYGVKLSPAPTLKLVYEQLNMD